MILINTTYRDWKEKLDSLLNRMRTTPPEVDSVVREIIRGIKDRGDAALFEYTRVYDGFDPEQEGLLITGEEIAKAASRVPSEIYAALKTAAERIEGFHRNQKEQSWYFTDETGSLLGQQVTAVESAGIYIPGGRNAFPSTILMNVIPAKIAGVDRIVVVSPTPEGRVNETLLAAAHVAGVDRIYRIGGAQAIAALAYGTKSIPKAHKVVGPGNIYVAHAKRLLQGIIGIDAFAGPSEILVIADGGANPKVVVSDLLSQAEHDAMASSILVTPSEGLAGAVLEILNTEAETLPRKDTVRASLDAHGACIITKDLEEAVTIANNVAPEHLELMVENAHEYLGMIRNAGAVFLGYMSPEAMGDYIAGPNHTLPTGSTARFSSPLGVYDFTKRTSVISLSADAIDRLGPMAARIARAEDLEAHARSVECRLKKQGS
jgi:histidinol dehydrogenase